MAPKKRTIIEKGIDTAHPDRVIVEEQLDAKDQPGVLAYRMGKVEDAVTMIGNKLDEYIKGFVTEKELAEERKRADEEHKKLWGAIHDMKANTKWWVTTAIAASGVIAVLISGLKKI